MIRILVLFYFSPVLASTSLGEVFQHGFIFPNPQNLSTNYWEICCVSLPKDGFKIYDKPNGNYIGIFTRNVRTNVGDQARYSTYFVSTLNKSPVILARNLTSEFSEPLVLVGYDEFVIRYFERKNGFVRVGNKAKQMWIDEQEINKKDFRLMEWQSFLKGANDVWVIGSTLELKEKPSVQAKTIKKLDSNLFEINLTTETYGLWVKANVIKHTVHPCEFGCDYNDRRNIEYKLHGWIQIVNSNGLPNVYTNTKGC